MAAEEEVRTNRRINTLIVMYNGTSGGDLNTDNSSGPAR